MKEQSHLKLKDLDTQDRPREKLQAHGLQSMSDTELLAIIINSGTTRHTALDLARIILNHFDNSLSKLGQADVATLCREFDGIGPARAIGIVAAMELGRRRSLQQPPARQKIACAADAFPHFARRIADLGHEEFWSMTLSSSGCIIDIRRIGQGGIAASLVDVRLVLRHAIEQSATAIIVAHNHPSGNLKPSSDDIALTRKLREAAKLLDIRLLDHLVVAGDHFASLADEGIL